MFEALHKYRLPHGEAVPIDIALTCAIGCELGLLQAADRDRVIGLLVSLGLPVTSSRLDLASCARALDESLAHRGGAVSLVVPTPIGRARFLSSRERPPSSALQAAMVLVGRHRPFRGRRPSSMECLAFDVGGTWLRAAVCEADPQTLQRSRSCRTPSVRTLPGASRTEILERLLAAMKELGNECLGGGQTVSVSVAFPGPVAPDSRVRAAPTVWGEAFPIPIEIAPELKHAWPEATIHVINDVTAAGYRHLRDSGEDVCVVTVSSGIGNKVFIGGSPQLGPSNLGGEIGHHQVDDSPDAPICDCGGRGHLGAIASGRGALRLARRLALEDRRAFVSSLAGSWWAAIRAASTTPAWLGRFASATPGPCT